MVDAVLRAVNIDNAEAATLAELAQQVQWDASDAATIARAFAGDMAMWTRKGYDAEAEADREGRSAAGGPSVHGPHADF